MSKVISFRLDPDNPREAQALKILLAKQAEGFSSRRVLADALITLEDRTGMRQVLSLDEFNEILERVARRLEKIGFENPDNAGFRSIDSPPHTLNDHFLQSVKVAAKPGINLEEITSHEQ